MELSFSPALPQDAQVIFSFARELIETYEEFADKQALWPDGEYSIHYYIDGCEVDRVTFTLD